MKTQLTKLQQAKLQMAISMIKILGKIVSSGNSTDLEKKRLEYHVKVYIDLTGEMPE